MKKIYAAAAAALAFVSFSTSAFAQAGSVQGGMSEEEHQKMMSGGGTRGQARTMSDPEMHRTMLAMMERCEAMMAEKGKRASASILESSWTSSADGKWAWRSDPRQAPGPRASQRAPIRVWVPAEKSPTS